MSTKRSSAGANADARAGYSDRPRLPLRWQPRSPGDDVGGGVELGDSS
jgi:hypothetical protein